MIPLINEFNSTILQIVILVGFPFVFYYINNRSPKGFLRWIGLFIAKPVPYKAIFIIFIGFAVFSFLPTGYLYLTESLRFDGYVYEAFQDFGVSFYSILTLILWAVFQTSFTEEVLFRGFIIRLFSEENAWIGNMVQAGVFGLIHVLIFFGKDILIFLLVFLLTAGIGYALGYLSINKADKSIMYGWFIHAVVNLLSVPLNLYLLKGL